VFPSAFSTHFLVETIAVIHSVRFFTRMLLFGGFGIVMLIFASLLYGELARGWASEIRRLLTP